MLRISLNSLTEVRLKKKLNSCKNYRLNFRNVAANIMHTFRCKCIFHEHEYFKILRQQNLFLLTCHKILLPSTISGGLLSVLSFNLQYNNFNSNINNVMVDIENFMFRGLYQRYYS